MITKYSRPPTLAAALALAQRPDAVVIGGGTSISQDRSQGDTEAVDLQALGLSDIVAVDSVVRIGATATLQDIVETGGVPDVLRDLARREAPVMLRNAATIGGTIGQADPESELLAGLLAFGAVVRVERVGSAADHKLDTLLGDHGHLAGSIITSITVPAGGTAAAHRTGRTPGDRPIVLAVAHRDEAGEIRLAMTGVADRPVLVEAGGIEQLIPPSDFRGTSEYRKHLASVLADRVLTDLGVATWA